MDLPLTAQHPTPLQSAGGHGALLRNAVHRPELPAAFLPQSLSLSLTHTHQA